MSVSGGMKKQVARHVDVPDQIPFQGTDQGHRHGASKENRVNTLALRKIKGVYVKHEQGTVLCLHCLPPSKVPKHQSVR
jgi:hypothetical protein